jgi:hypothetical protein
MLCHASPSPQVQVDRVSALRTISTGSTVSPVSFPRWLLLRLPPCLHLLALCTLSSSLALCAHLFEFTSTLRPFTTWASPHNVRIASQRAHRLTTYASPHNVRIASQRAHRLTTGASPHNVCIASQCTCIASHH